MKIRYLIIYFTLVLSCSSSFAAKKIESSHVFYTKAHESFEKHDWKAVITTCRLMIKEHPESSFMKECLYYLAVAYFNTRELELSDRYFSRYLKGDYSPKYFEEAMNYKFAIAEEYKNGAKKRMLTKGPKLVEAEEDAITLYEEVIATLPTSEIAAKSMFSLSQIKKTFHEYKESISLLENLIKRFPTSDIAIESYIEIARIYNHQTTRKEQNPDFLELALLNLKKFKTAFPYEDAKLIELEGVVNQMKETFAKGFYDIARFYEKTKKPNASKIYYSKIINNFPETKYADESKKRLEILDKT